MIFHKRPERVVCILGMHRSGTSCLAGSLQLSGLHLGKHHTWNKYNLKGNRENQDIVDLHESIFKANRISWDSPVPAASWRTLWRRLPVRWHKQHFECAEGILSQYSDQHIWGFKDPRSLLVLSGWKKLIPDIQFVGIYRHPLAVAKSIFKRDDPSLSRKIEHGLQLWYEYNVRLLTEYRYKPFPVLTFDWNEATYHEKLNKLNRELGLRLLNENERFYAAELQTQGGNEDIVLPDRIRSLYVELQTITL